jgi:hypothetical protein
MIPYRLLRRPYPAVALVLVALFFAATAGLAQQTDVRRFDFYTGYSRLNSPKINLSEHGMQLQFGYRPRTWYSIGFDYNIVSGDLRLTPDLLPTALQQSLGQQLAGLAALGRLPAGYSLVVPANSTTHSFALGPQLAYRHFKKVTLFLRPSMGAIRETATPTPTDAIAQAIVKGLAPEGKKTDWQGFYGFGYGFDVNFTHHFSIRAQGDLVWDHLFNDILQDGRWTSRFSVGPAFNFGKNIVSGR